MEIIDGVKYLEAGDIIELEGKKYYMEYYDGYPCGHCALNGILCETYFYGDNMKYDCAEHSVFAISAEKKIKELEEEIKGTQELIKKLS